MRHLIERVLELDRRWKRLIQAAVDAFLILAVFWLALALRFDGLPWPRVMTYWNVLLAVLPVTLLAFTLVGLYRSVLRFIGSEVLKLVFYGVLASMLTMIIVDKGFSLPLPRSVPFIYATFLFLAVSGVRFGYRALVRQSAKVRPSVIIYGAGESGRQLASALRQGVEFAPVAYVDDNPEIQGSMVGGLRVHAPAKIRDLVLRYDVSAILLAFPSATRTERRRVIQALQGVGAEIKTIPGMTDIITGRAAFSELRQVTPEDMLGRDPVPPREDLMSVNLRGKSVLVTGAGGSIGGELCRQILAMEPSALVMLDVSEFALYRIEDQLRPLAERTGKTRLYPLLGSVQNRNRMRAILRGFGVQTVFHAAAYKHVPLVEMNVVEGVRNNVFGTQSIASAAAECGVEAFILISTDKAVRPTNVMGATKRLAELVCQAEAEKSSRTVFSMVRFGNVLGSSGSVIPRFQKQIARGGPVTVTHPDITRYFMTIPEAAQLVIQAGAMANGGEVFVLDMGEPVRIVEMAESIIRLHGLTPYFADAPQKPGERADKGGDIAIAFTGLRPGEKLFEELLIGTTAQPTAHSRIFKERADHLMPEVLDAQLDRLMAGCLDFDVPRIWQIILEMPTEFHPSGTINDLLSAEVSRQRKT